MMGQTGQSSSALDNMNPEKFKSTMHSLAYGNVMAAAARDYQNEMLAEQRAGGAAGQSRDIDIDDLLDDPELERLHAERLAAMQKEAEKRAALQRKGHGELQDISEEDFLEVVTNTSHVVTHFYHDGFERCKVLDKHLAVLAKKYVETRFVKLSAPDAPFFTVKLGVKVLPCIIMFINGVATDRIVGFNELGAKDDFPTATLERRLLKSGVITPQKSSEDGDSDDLPEHVRRTVYKSQMQRGSEDEDSKFSD